MNACEHCRELLMDLLYEDLGPAVRWEAENHLRSCPECAREYDELKKTIGAVRDLADPDPPLGLKTRVKAQVKAAIPRKKPVWELIPRRAYAAAAMIVIGVTVGLIMAVEYPRIMGRGPSSDQAALADKEKGKEVALLTPPARESAVASVKDEKADNYVGGYTAPIGPPAPEAAPPPAPAVGETPPAVPAEAPPAIANAAEAEDKLKAAAEPGAAGLQPATAPETVAESKKTEEVAKNEPSAAGLQPASAAEPAKAKPEDEVKEEPRGWTWEPARPEPDKPAAAAPPKEKEKAPEPPASAGKGAVAPEGVAREEAQPPPSAAAPEKKAKAETLDHEADTGRAAGSKDMLALEKAAPKPSPEAKRDDGAKAGGSADKSRPAPPWEGPGARSAPAPTPPADHAAGNVTPASPLDQADTLETQGRYRQALDVYEGVLRSSGYPGEAAPRGRRPEADTKAEPGAKSVVKPRCGSDTTRAVNGALRCYKRLLQLGKARDLEDWYKNQCQK